MTDAVQRVLGGPVAKSSVTRGKSFITENKLHSPDSLIQKIDNDRAEKEEKKNERKRKREKEESERLAKRLKSTCIADSCKKWSRKLGDAKGWKKRTACGGLFCKVHSSLLASHETPCSQLHNEALAARIGEASAAQDSAAAPSAST